jgi:hypothetical protein
MKESVKDVQAKITNGRKRMKSLCNSGKSRGYTIGTPEKIFVRR